MEENLLALSLCVFDILVCILWIYIATPVDGTDNRHHHDDHDDVDQFQCLDVTLIVHCVHRVCHTHFINVSPQSRFCADVLMRLRPSSTVSASFSFECGNVCILSCAHLILTIFPSHDPNHTIESLGWMQRTNPV